jgi:O-antigen/teichoic acid export membrane protein
VDRIRARLPWAVFWALAAQGILSITRFFSKMVVGGRFGSGESGYGGEAELAYYDAAFGILMLVMALHEALVTTPLTFFNHREKKTVEQKFAGKMLSLSLLFSMATLVVMAIATWYQYAFGGIGQRFLWAMIALTALMPLQAVKEFSKRWLLANLQARKSAMLEIVFAASFLVLIAGLIYTAKVNAATVFGITIVANFICLIGWWIYFRKSFAVELVGVRQQVVDNFRYGKWIAGENICSVAMLFFSQWFLISSVGEVTAGVYSACLTIVFLANPFLLGVSSIFAPSVAREFNDKGWQGMFSILLSYGAFVVLVLIAFSALLFFVGQSLTTFAFGQKYADYFAATSGGRNTVTFLLSLAMPCFGVSFLLTCCLLAADKPIYCFYAAAIGLVATIGTNLSFAQPTLHTAGASFVVGAFTAMMFKAIVVWKMYLNYQKAERRSAGETASD